MEENRYYKALQNHPFSLTDEEVSDKVDKLIAEKFVVNNTGEVWKLLYSCIDLTTLNSTDTKEEVWRFTEKVNDFDGSNPEIENVLRPFASIPTSWARVKAGLNGRLYALPPVSGGFPASQTFTEVKIAENSPCRG